jgi:uncharacterized membrane protein YhaH (DUF805 family)
LSAASYSLAATFGLRGRIGRRQFAVSTLYQGTLSAALAAAVLALFGGPLVEGLADAQLAGSMLPGDPALLFPVLLLTGSQVALSTFTFTAIRARLHDLSFSSGWTVPMSIPSLIWLAGEFLPLGGIGNTLSTAGAWGQMVLVAPLFAVPGTAGANPYGPPPLTRPPAAASAVSAGRHAG